MKVTFPMTAIQPFFNLGLTFSVDGDRLRVDGFQQFSPEDRRRLQESIKARKPEIIESIHQQDRLKAIFRELDREEPMELEEYNRLGDEARRIIAELGSKMGELLAPE